MVSGEAVNGERKERAVVSLRPHFPLTAHRSPFDNLDPGIMS
jgi:hypothetical protein